MTHFPQGLERIGGQPTNFIPKIWKGVITAGVKMNAREFADMSAALTQEQCTLIDQVKPKLHTFRENYGNRWKPGKLIHSIINNRTPKRVQFLPTITCTAVQDVFIHPHSKTMQIWRLDQVDSNPDSPFEGWWQDIPPETVETIAVNDGFENIDDFYNYFGKEWGGGIIHWTDLRY